MSVRYYAVRRVNPYRGVVQIVDAGDALAHSYDGATWHLREDDGFGRIRPVGVWEEGVGQRLGHAPRSPGLINALENRPDLPFAMFDTWELWLLEGHTGLPLALLDTARQSEPRSVSREVTWHPFVLSYTGFHSAALAASNLPGSLPHRERLAHLVNAAARPPRMAQWFKRDQAGVGVGASGIRIAPEWQGRSLPAKAFPELLVRAAWNNPLEQSVIADYHAWLAPLLLLWPRLTASTRDGLEAQACETPLRLARVYRLLPAAVDAARVNAAMVAARLQQAHGSVTDHWIED